MSLLKKNGGFTLVELIVVIAILAILAGVAVPAYSGYVEKANMQADITLARDAANALALHYYADPKNATVDSVVLTNTGIQADGFAADAMTATFGEGWENLQLKYSGWTTADVAQTVMGSSYLSNGRTSDDLLDSVSVLTNMAASAMGTGSAQTLVDLGFVGADFLTGIPAGAEVGSDEYKNSVGNLLVLHVADELANYDPESEKPLSKATELAFYYAAVYSYYSADAENGAQEIAALNDRIANAAASGSGGEKLDALNAVVNQAMTNEVMDAFYQGNNELAFIEIMKGASGLSENILASGDLTSSGMWKSETVTSTVGGYFDAMEAISGLGSGGAGIIVMVNQNGSVATTPKIF